MKRRLGLLFALLMALSVFGPTAVTADTTVSAVFPGNDTCEDGTKIDPVEAGTYDLVGGGWIVITLGDGKSFSFDTEGSATVSAITVKGGPNYHTYFFSPAVESASGLTAPINPNNDKPYGLSHLCIESEKKGPSGEDPK